MARNAEEPLMHQELGMQRARLFSKRRVLGVVSLVVIGMVIAKTVPSTGSADQKPRVIPLASTVLSWVESELSKEIMFACGNQSEDVHKLHQQAEAANKDEDYKTSRAACRQQESERSRDRLLGEGKCNADEIRACRQSPYVVCGHRDACGTSATCHKSIKNEEVAVIGTCQKRYPLLSALEQCVYKTQDKYDKLLCSHPSSSAELPYARISVSKSTQPSQISTEIVEACGNQYEDNSVFRRETEATADDNDFLSWLTSCARMEAPYVRRQLLREGKCSPLEMNTCSQGENSNYICAFHEKCEVSPQCQEAITRKEMAVIEKCYTKYPLMAANEQCVTATKYKYSKQLCGIAE